MPVDGAQLSASIEAGFGRVSTKTAARWVRRYRERRVTGRWDGSSNRGHLRQPTSVERALRVEALGSERWTGLLHGVYCMGLTAWGSRPAGGQATVSRILRRLPLSRRCDLGPRLLGRWLVARRRSRNLFVAGPALQARRWAACRTLDIKELGHIDRLSLCVTGDRPDPVDGAGREYMHVPIDDHSRIAFSAIYPKS